MRREQRLSEWSGYSWNAQPLDTLEDLSGHPALGVEGAVRFPVGRMGKKVLWVRRSGDGLIDAAFDDDDEKDEGPQIDYDASPLDASPVDSWPAKVRSQISILRKL